MSQHLDALMARLRRNAGTWIDASEIARDLHLPLPKVVALLESTRKAGKFKVRRKGVGSGSSPYAFMIDKPPTLTREPVYANDPPQPQPIRNDSLLTPKAVDRVEHDRTYVAPEPIMPPREAQRARAATFAAKGFAIGDTAHPPASADRVATNGVARASVPSVSIDGADYVLLLDLARDGDTMNKPKYEMLVSRAHSRGLIVEVPNPRSGIRGQRRIAKAVRTGDVPKLYEPIPHGGALGSRAKRDRVEPVEPIVTSPPSPPSPPSLPSLPVAEHAATHVQPPTLPTGITVRPMLMTRLTRIALAVQSPISELVNTAIESWLDDVEPK